MSVQKLYLNDNWNVYTETNITRGEYAVQANYCYKAKLPACVHSVLLENEVIPDPFYGENEKLIQWIPEYTWCFERLIPYPWEYSYPSTKYLLVFECIDTVADVFLDGKRLGFVENMFHKHEFDITSLASCCSHDMQLKVVFPPVMEYIKKREKTHPYREWNDPVGGASRVRKAQYSFGWDWYV
jgi:beta-mannosidase